MRKWLIETPVDQGTIHYVDVKMPGYLPVTIYADTTRQFSEEEIDKMMRSQWGQMMEIPVPEDLLFQWFFEEWNYAETLKKPEAIEFGLSMETAKSDFATWFYQESTADDCDTLYDWLVSHNYCWKRLD